MFTGQCWSKCLLGNVGAGVQWSVLEQVFTGQFWSRCSLGSAGVGVHLSPGQYWSRCSLVIWAVL